MELTKIQPNASVRIPSFLLTCLIFLTSSLFAQPGKNLENAEIYEAIGMMFADGSGLAKMKFTDEQIDQILSGMKKGISLGKMPPEAEALMPKVQQIMMEKMKIARAAEQEGMKGLAAENKAKAKEFLSLNKEILKIDLINKGLMKAETWEQIERVILKLQDATALQH